MGGVARRKLHFVAVEAEGGQDQFREFHAGGNFIFDLFGGAENVRVVLRESAHAQQAVHHARALVAVDRAEFRQAHGQLAVTAARGFINHDVARTIHGLELILGVVERHGGEHVFAVEIRVAAGLP